MNICVCVSRVFWQVKNNWHDTHETYTKKSDYIVVHNDLTPLLIQL